MKLPRFLLALLISVIALVLPFLANSFDLNNTVSAQGPLEIGVVYTCAKKQQFRIVSCDERDNCQVFRINKASPTGGFTLPYTKRSLSSEITDYKCSTAPPVSVDPPGEAIEFGVIYACSDSFKTEFKVISCDELDSCRVQTINRASPSGGPIGEQNRKSIRENIKTYACVTNSASSSAASVDAFSTTINTPPLNARSIDLFKPNLGAFKLLNASLKVELPSLLINLSILEQARDSAEGLYQSRSGKSIKLISLSYPSVDVSVSMLDRVELEMRRNSSKVTLLKRKKGRAFLVEISLGKSFVVWTNNNWAFLTFGEGQEVRLLANDFGY